MTSSSLCPILVQGTTFSVNAGDRVSEWRGVIVHNPGEQYSKNKIP